MYLSEAGIPANGTRFAALNRLQLVRMQSQQQFLVAATFNDRTQLSLEIFAARKKKGSLRKEGDFRGLPCPIRPPSLFVKQSPVPSRRPLRCVPYTNFLLDAASEENEQSSNMKPERRKIVSSNEYLVEKSEQGKDTRSGKVSKWASLFEIAGSNPVGSGGMASGGSQVKDADAWFDKIFPKNTSNQEGGGSADASAATPKLSAQQEKSIQQLQTLVKTLGVATRNPAPPARRNKPTKIRQLPVQGGVVDPVPFSSILKKLQSVSSSAQEEQRSKLEEAPARLERLKSAMRSGKATRVADEEEDDDEELSDEEDDSEAESESSSGEEDEEKQAAAVAETEVEETRSSSPEVKTELCKLTVVALKALAKEKGLSGYSKLKKDDLVQLLVKL